MYKYSFARHAAPKMHCFNAQRCTHANHTAHTYRMHINQNTARSHMSSFDVHGPEEQPQKSDHR